VAPAQEPEPAPAAATHAHPRPEMGSPLYWIAFAAVLVMAVMGYVTH